MHEHKYVSVLDGVWVDPTTSLAYNTSLMECKCKDWYIRKVPANAEIETPRNMG